MNNLNDLVPPLELCKKIPDGEFTDTCFQWQESNEQLNKATPGDLTDVIQHYPEQWGTPPGFNLYPAPTLEEIIRKIRLDLLCGIEHHGDFYVSNRHIGCFEDERAATAALKMWLELKGI